MSGNKFQGTLLCSMSNWYSIYTVLHILQSFPGTALWGSPHSVNEGMNEAHTKLVPLSTIHQEKWQNQNLNLVGLAPDGGLFNSTVLSLNSIYFCLTEIFFYMIVTKALLNSYVNKTTEYLFPKEIS